MNNTAEPFHSKKKTFVRQRPAVCVSGSSSLSLSRAQLGPARLNRSAKHFSFPESFVCVCVLLHLLSLCAHAPRQKPLQSIYFNARGEDECERGQKNQNSFCWKIYSTHFLNAHAHTVHSGAEQKCCKKRTV